MIITKHLYAHRHENWRSEAFVLHTSRSHQYYKKHISINGRKHQKASEYSEWQSIYWYFQKLGSQVVLLKGKNVAVWPVSLLLVSNFYFNILLSRYNKDPLHIYRFSAKISLQPKCFFYSALIFVSDSCRTLRSKM